VSCAFHHSSLQKAQLDQKIKKVFAFFDRDVLDLEIRTHIVKEANMKRSFKATIITLILLALLAYLGIYMSGHTVAVLEPKGMIGVKEKDLINTASLLMMIVVIPVFIFALVFAWRYRTNNKKARHDPDWEHNYIAEYCWWGVPLVIVTILAVLTWKSSHELNPFKPLAIDKKPLTIQVVALQWKWLFLYPEQSIATINYVQFPEKTPINFEITSDAPMNSFWIPQLGGQIYAMPAMRSKLHLIANEPGHYRGVSANISGDGFAGMYFSALASSEAEFEQWVESVKQSGTALDQKTYDQLVEPSEFHPVVYYNLTEPDLFNEILMKYMMPTSK
jgi:cytochrome o ubiquinol oxidase subunit 2